MAREYKLRLGDGTVMAVDEQGLRTWAIDPSAAVQVGGAGQWRPLKEILAEVAASGPSGRSGRRDDGIPLIPLKPIDDVSRPPNPNNLPALRLAADEDPVEDVELYEGNSALSLAWLWLKRLVLVGGLVVGGVVAFNTWPTWFPVATRLGLALFTKIDEHAHPERAKAPAADAKQEEREAALQRAHGQLPHMSPETIRQVLASSVWSVPEPPEVFSRAYTAARRGSPSLTAPEAEELKTLEAALVASLRPADRQRLREYDRARMQRATLPAEDRDMADLYARGARALPAPSRERLRALYGKAVAAGLASGGA